MTLEAIIQFMEKQIGVKTSLISFSVWEEFFQQRMKISRISTYNEYLQYLQSSVQELQELIELIIVPETWFFRDKKGFEFFLYYIHHYWQPNGNQQPLKIMSLPCSTGEEPYSIAMALLNEGLKCKQFTIDAVDISQLALAKARKAIYKKNSFRGKELHYREQYFHKEKEEYVLKPIVKESVKFHLFNAISPHVPFEIKSYDFIFCRNLLIYLNEEAQSRVLGLLKYLLKPSGYLIVGPVEMKLVQQFGFNLESFNKGSAFCLEKNYQSSQQQAKHSNIFDLHKLIKRTDTQIFPVDIKTPSAELLESEKITLIEEATKLANRGQFIESTSLCLKYIYQFGAHPHIYYLLGLMKHAEGFEKQAEGFFKKTIYLQPSHYEALVYLALLYEKREEFAKAELFHKRAQKFMKH